MIIHFSSFDQLEVALCGNLNMHSLFKHIKTLSQKKWIIILRNMANMIYTHVRSIIILSALKKAVFIIHGDVDIAWPALSCNWLNVRNNNSRYLLYIIHPVIKTPQTESKCLKLWCRPAAISTHIKCIHSDRCYWVWNLLLWGWIITSQKYTKTYWVKVQSVHIVEGWNGY